MKAFASGAELKDEPLGAPSDAVEGKYSSLLEDCHENT
jgi:hypothetical protein